MLIYTKLNQKSCNLPLINVCEINPVTGKKKRLESKLCRKYVLNLLNEPQHLAKIKTPKLLKIPNKGVTNLRERKLKNMQILRFRENKRKVREKMSMSVFQCQGKGSLT